MSMGILLLSVTRCDGKHPTLPIDGSVSIMDFLLDSASDVANLPTTGDYVEDGKNYGRAANGSRASNIPTGVEYFKNSAGVWTKRGDSIDLSSITITAPPTKVSYAVGESFDPDGMVVTATYSNGATKAISDYSYAPIGALAATDVKVTVSFVEDGVAKTAEQAITVA